MASKGSSLFQRYFLPGFAFKAVVIGGGYATGRELAEYFFPAGPLGGLFGMLLSMVLWSLICAATFLFAHSTRSYDYGGFFRHLLGRAWALFDIVFAFAMLVGLSVFGAAAGAIGAALFGWPVIAGTLVLVVSIASVVAFGNESVERVFKYVTYFLYGVYVIFFVLVLTRSSDLIATQFSTPRPLTGWAVGGATYAAYNAVGAVLILAVLRHQRTSREAVVSGLLCGPLGMLPAILFFICMVGFYPAVAGATLPSDYMLERMNVPLFHFVFQLMIFAALLESGVGLVHSINERIAGVLRARGRGLPASARLWIAGAMLVVSIFVADSFGLVALIAHGYRWLAYAFIAVFVLPILTYGLWSVFRNGQPPLAVNPHA